MCQQAEYDYRVSVAPMMKRTDRHFRYLIRLLSQKTFLYSEMVTTGAVIHGPKDRLLGFNPVEGPIALQLGGDDPSDLAEAAHIAEGFGYDEVNLNVGCPSERVQNGSFGACLMAQPAKVAKAVEAMKTRIKIPVTVKHRIGVDEMESYGAFKEFVDTVAAAGADRFSVHARKAWLKGLNPKQNRTIPPLKYEFVYRLKEECPSLFVEINGGISNWDEAEVHLREVDAVMLGRAAYDNPFLFAQADSRFYPGAVDPIKNRRELVERMIPYIEDWIGKGGRAHHVTRHMLQIFAGCPRGKLWRRRLNDIGRLDLGTDALLKALGEVTQSPLAA
ncbi:MAG: tRNA dihydrouridine(20/20a) synthase DusA [Myxococcota bacterium]|nr:tRNA dihydrouridine(20/20a) synthase DusA [Myxococcota bacterium]